MAVAHVEFESVTIFLWVSLRSKPSRKKADEIRAMRRSFRESKKVEGRGWGRGKKGTLARKPLDFEKPGRQRTGLLIGAAWSS